MDDGKRKLLRIDIECQNMILVKAIQHFIPVVQFCFGDVTQKYRLEQGNVLRKSGKGLITKGKEACTVLNIMDRTRI